VAERCLAKNIVMRPSCTIRTPLEQARLWRQGRTSAVIQAKIRELMNMDCHFLAGCIDLAGYQKNPNVVTNALPGQSAHQWGEACDMFWFTGNQGCWDINWLDENGHNGYVMMWKFLLEAGYKQIKLGKGKIDFPHIQSIGFKLPKDLKEINDEMQKRFGGSM
jgi:hypothetical protein